jgi:hypothetical protein
MLKDRKALLEQEIRKSHDAAANMYLSIVVSAGDVHSKEYQDLKQHITDLQFDLNMVNQLLSKGHQ